MHKHIMFIMCLVFFPCVPPVLRMAHIHHAYTHFTYIYTMLLYNTKP